MNWRAASNVQDAATPCLLRGIVPLDITDSHLLISSKQTSAKQSMSFTLKVGSTLDIKPDKVYIDWTRDDNGNKLITRTTLGDFDIAFKLQDGETRITPHTVGNVMWRSPEAQACMANRATDIYSLLVVSPYNVAKQGHALLNDSRSSYTH
ncbi:hypothetical protein AC578_3699 [Pseudocercospora eumusae]|uniref:Protein kinase domain-containing protein n=1 Tax=Pseudocercospora eumusae TaxID=321146 RepID=A0A139HSV4_9PEZI|nr:hypothetical protein AC578_3699 [Pseudocercospora eumusae]